MAYIGREPLSGEVVLINSIESQFNGVLTTFNLTRTVNGVTSAFYPISSEQLLVSLGGVIQEPDPTGDTGFRISFNQIIFAIAPAAGVSCFIVCYGNLLDIGSPANNTVTTEKLVDGSVTPIKLSTGGPWWLTNGNVGIGTDSIAEKLHIHTANDGLSAIRISGTANLQTPYNIRQGIVGVSNAGFSIWDVNAAATRFAIDSSGNVGIGVANPVAKLHVDGSIHQTWHDGRIGIFYDNDFRQGLTYSTSTRTLKIFSTSSDTGGNIAFYTRLGVGASDTDYGSEKLRIAANGNVGIGTTNPQRPLHVTGSGIGLGADADIRQGSGIEGGSSYARLQLYNPATGTTTLENLGAFAVDIRNNGSSRIYINSSGNVGIGTTNPASKLEVVGIASASSGLRTLEQVRATGWWNTPTGSSYSGLGVEMGMSGGIGYILCYNRDNSSYGTLRIQGGDTMIELPSSGYTINVTGNISTTGIVQSGGGRLVLRDDSVENHATDSDGAAVVVSYAGYASGYTRFRDFHLYNGKAGLILKVVGSSGNVGIGSASPTSKLDVVGTVTATNFGDATGGYNVNLGNGTTEGRGLVAGYSGGSYGGIGYNVRHTTTGGTYIAPTSDTSNYLLFNQGFTFFGETGGAAGRTLSYSSLARIDNSGNLSQPVGGSFHRIAYSSGSNNYSSTLWWNGLALGNNGDNFIVAGRTAVGGSLKFYVNNTIDISSNATPGGTLALTLASTAAATFSSSVTASGGFYSPGEVGFYSSYYAGNARNPIWRFANADGYGLSYFQGGAGVSPAGGGDTIGFHFGTATAAASLLQLNNGHGAVVNGNFGVTGNVGIGTTNPTTILHVKGGANQYALFQRGAKSLIVNANWSDNNAWAQIAPVASDSMGLSLSSRDTSPEYLFIANSGNVGIGTTTPLQKFDVRGKFLLAADATTSTHITQVPYTINNGTLSWEGSAGQLFSITNNLTSGSIFSVNDVSGLPSIDVDADGTIKLAPYGGTVVLKQVTETVANTFTTTLAPSSGTLTVDISLGTVILGDLNAPVITWAFTNVPTANSRATTITLIIDGDTAHTYGEACSVNGSAITGGVKWVGGDAPTPTVHFDIITFTIVRDSAGTIIVFGSGNTNLFT
jgi:hypothetical protein